MQVNKIIPSAAALVIAVGLAVHFEGKSNTPYYDPPGVLTICYGHTGGIKLGTVVTDTECKALLQSDIADADAVITRLVIVPLPDTRRAALIDFIYNAGAGNFARSTLLRKLNSGDAIGACSELSKWVYSGGVRLTGLVRRRQAERDLCLL